MSAASAAASAVQQRQTADDQANYQKKLQKGIAESARIKASSIRTQQLQEQDAVARQKDLAITKSLEARGTLQAVNSETGLTGQNYESLVGEFKRQESGHLFALDEQQRLIDIQRNQEVRAGSISAGYQLTQAGQPIAQPNYLGIGLGALGKIATETNWKALGVKDPAE